MASKKEPTGFQRFCAMHEGATEQDYLKALQQFQRKNQNKIVGPPNVVFTPNGVIVPRSSISSSEIGQMNGEAAKDSLKN